MNSITLCMVLCAMVVVHAEEYPYECRNGGEMSTVTDTIGDRYYPGYRGARWNYESNENVCWRFNCPAGQDVLLTFSRIRTEAGNDYINIYSKKVTGYYTRDEQFSGTHNNIPEKAYPGTAVLQLTSDSSVERTGIEYSFVCVEGTTSPDASPAPSSAPTPAPPVPDTPIPSMVPFPEHCKEETVLSENGVINHFFESGYAPDENLCWMMHCDGTIVASFRKFDTELGYDEVTIFSYDGNTPSAVDTFSGSEADVVVTVSGTMAIRFASDYNTQGKGFEMQYTCVDATAAPTDAPLIPAPPGFHEECANAVNVVLPADGTLSHGPYGSDEKRCWRLDCEGEVTASFVAFETEMYYDIVNVYSNQDAAVFVPVLEKYGAFASLPHQLVLEGPAVVKFESNYMIEAAGFSLQYTCVPRSTRADELATLREYRARFYDEEQGGHMASWTGEDYCTWPGISCNGDQRVVAFNMAGQGTLTARVNDFSKMQYMTSFIVDSTMANGFDGFASSLVEVSFSHTPINGPIPSVVANLPGLVKIIARGAGLTGAFPTFAPTAMHIEVQDNQLTGEVPLPLPANIINFIVNNNLLTGPVPQSNSVKRMVIDTNNFSGPLPAAFPNLLLGSFHSNSLTGSYDPESTPLATEIDISNNFFDGVLPNFAGTSVEMFKGYNNRMTGSFHHYEAGQHKMAQLIINNNRLTGTEPTAAEAALVANLAKWHENSWGMIFDTQTNHFLVWLEGGVLFSAIFCYFGVVGHTKFCYTSKRSF